MNFATIPWFKLEPWTIAVPYIGALKLQPFGVLAGVALLVGTRRAERRADQLGLQQNILSSFLYWTTAVGLISAYVLNIVLYEPERLAEIAEQPSRLITHWYGLSSYGGFIGGTVTAIVFAHQRRVSLVKLGDAWCYAIPFAWIFARMGCFVVHDHPGRASEFFLAVDNYDGSGVARHDLGLYEVLWSLVVSGLFSWLDRRPRAAGLYLALIPSLYGPVRFALDFLRASPLDGGDVRYLGLTPAQYLSIALSIAGAILYLRIRDVGGGVDTRLLEACCLTGAALVISHRSLRRSACYKLRREHVGTRPQQSRRFA